MKLTALERQSILSHSQQYSHYEQANLNVSEEGVAELTGGVAGGGSFLSGGE